MRRRERTSSKITWIGCINKSKSKWRRIAKQQLRILERDCRDTLKWVCSVTVRHGMSVSNSSVRIDCCKSCCQLMLWVFLRKSSIHCMSNGDNRSFPNIARIVSILGNCCKRIWLKVYSHTKQSGVSLCKQFNKMIDLWVCWDNLAHNLMNCFRISSPI